MSDLDGSHTSEHDMRTVGLPNTTLDFRLI